MIRFIMDNGKAIIFDDVGEENGWVVEYDPIGCYFAVWDNAERHITENPSVICKTLEDVLKTVNSYT